MGVASLNSPKFHLVSLLSLNYLKTNIKPHQPNPTSCQVLLPTCNSDHFSFPLSVLQSVAKIGNCSALRSQQPSVAGPHQAGCAAARGPQRCPSRTTRPPDSDCVISAKQPCTPGEIFTIAQPERQQPFAAQCKQVPKSPPFCTTLTWGAPKPQPLCTAGKDPFPRG